MTSLHTILQMMQRELRESPLIEKDRTALIERIKVIEQAIADRDERDKVNELLVRHLQQVLGRLMGKISNPPLLPAGDAHTLLTQIDHVIDWMPSQPPAEQYSELLGFSVHLLHEAAIKAQTKAPAPKTTLYGLLCQVRDLIQKIPDPRVAPPPSPREAARLDATLAECQVGRARSLVADIAARLGTGVNTTGVTSPIRGLEIAYDLVCKEVVNPSPLVKGLDGVVTFSTPNSRPRARLVLHYDTFDQANAAADLVRRLRKGS